MPVPVCACVCVSGGMPICSASCSRRTYPRRCEPTSSTGCQLSSGTVPLWRRQQQQHCLLRGRVAVVMRAGVGFGRGGGGVVMGGGEGLIVVIFEGEEAVCLWGDARHSAAGCRCPKGRVWGPRAARGRVWGPCGGCGDGMPPPPPRCYHLWPASFCRRQAVPTAFAAAETQAAPAAWRRLRR